MPDETTAPQPEVSEPKPKRQYRKRKKRTYTRRVPKIAGTPKSPEPVPVVAAPVKPAPQRRVPERALAEIDSQLTAAIAALPDAEETLTVLEGKSAEQSQRVTRIRQRISQLLDLQRQLNGEVPPLRAIPVTIPGNSTLTGLEVALDPRVQGMVPGWQKDIPPGVGSIPARQPQPSNGNVADQAKGGGWE